jgi:hypothetical protein
MAELARLGTAQNRKVYRRHGVGEPLFGVSYGNLRNLAKRIRVDQDLARELWDSGNHDARVPARAGWEILALQAVHDRELPDSHFEERTPVIEEGIHRAKNRVRDAMNSALIGIGLRSARLRPWRPRRGSDRWRWTTGRRGARPPMPPPTSSAAPTATGRSER